MQGGAGATMVRFNDVVFDREMLWARRGDGTEVRLSRQERALLLHISSQPGRLFTRGRLCDLLARNGEPASDRNVDFLVSRLRRRLGDDARHPRFIATQYGEGYVWIARPSAPEPEEAFLRIGPIFGLPRRRGREHRIVDRLAALFAGALGQGHRVATVFDGPPVLGVPDPTPFVLKGSFHDDGKTLHAAFVLLRGPDGRVVRTVRSTFAGDEEGVVERIVSDCRAAIWSDRARTPAAPLVVVTELPLEVRMHEAALMLAMPPERWRETEAQLARARAERPNDSDLDVMWCIHLYLQLLRPPHEGPLMTQTERAEIEAKIEAVALESLAAVQDNPLLVLAIAKLLLFVDRGHLALVDRLADEAFAKSTGFAAAFATQAQIRMYSGRIGEALRLLDSGAELSEPASEFQVYLLILKCIALMAAGRRRMLDRTSDQLYALRPEYRFHIGLMLADPTLEALSPDLEMVLAAIDEAAARSALDYLFYVAGRRFPKLRQRSNVMAGLTTHLSRRFGGDIVPARIARSIGLQA